MEKPIRSKFRVEDEKNNTIVDVEVIDRESNADLLEAIEDDEDPNELELEDIDILQLRESSARFTAGELQSDVQEGVPIDWGRYSAAPPKSAMVLYPKPSTTQVVDDLEKVISALPTISQVDVTKNQTKFRGISYIAVAAISILGTWLVMKGVETDPPAASKTSERITDDVKIGDGVVEKPSSPAMNEKSPSVAIPASTPRLEKFVSTASTAGMLKTPDVTSERRVESASQSGDANAAKASGQVTPGGDPPAVVRSSPAAEQKLERSAATSGTPNKSANTIKRESVSNLISRKKRENSSVAATSFLPDKENSSLPEMPSKALVRSTMQDLASKVRDCKGNISGRVIVEVIVSGATGTVISSKAIDQVEVGATAGRCAARAVENVRFPPFSKSRLTIKYPYDL